MSAQRAPFHPRPHQPPRVAVGPEPLSWAVGAVEAGGGVVVDVLEEPDALVWTDAAGAHAHRLQSVVEQSRSIAWVQLPLAGVDRMFELGAFDRLRLWTSAKGAYAEPVAEHALALTLAGLRGLPDRVRATSWGEPAGVSLYGQPVTIVGGGGIAESLVALLAPFRCDVTIVRRRPAPMPGPGVRGVVGPDELQSAVRTALVVVLALALTPQTRNMVGHDVLSHMRNDAWIVNVARGSIVETDALVDALRRGAIAGAALDVTDPEPLPAEHPLWRMPNCLITPHTADTPEIVQGLLSRRIRENVERFSRGDPLIGIVDIDLGY